MNWIEILLTVGVAVIFAILAQLSSRLARGGWLVHLGIGLLGAFAGVVVARSFTVPQVYILEIGIVRYPIIWAIIGAVLFLAALGFFVKTERR